MNFNKIKYQIPFTVLALIIVLAGCSTKTEKTEAAEDVKEEAIQAKKDLKAKYQETIQALDKKITGLEAKLEGATDEVEQNVTATIDELKNQRQKMVEEIAEISKAPEENWKSIKTDAEDILMISQAKIDSLTIKAEELFN